MENHSLPLFRFYRAKTAVVAALIFLGFSYGRTLSAIEAWEQLAANQFTADINAIAFDGTQFVAVGKGGFVATSPDGITWTQGSLGNNSEYESIAYGNGRFVAVGELAPVISSADGITWQVETVGSTRINGAAFGNNLFVIVGGIGSFWTSPDGQSWTKQPVLTTSGLRAAVYGGGQFVVVSRGGKTLTSPDGENWTLHEGVANTDLTSVSYGNWLYAATSSSGTVFTSFDGIHWLEQNVTEDSTPLRGIAFGNGHFALVGNGSESENGTHLWTSTDGATWTRRNAIVKDALNGVTFRDGKFLAVGDNGSIIRSSTDTITPEASRFINLSNRALVGTGDEILIGSIILLDYPLRVYARVGGPSLQGAGIANFLENPTMELVKLGTPNLSIGFNDDWKSDQENLIESTGISPANDNEPAMVSTLQPGTYSIVVRGVADTTGFANVELYEFRDPAGSDHGSIINLSNRAFVGVGDDILIGSMIIQGEVPMRIYARVAGSSLADAGIANFLADPTLELIRLGNPNVVIGSNDNWKSDQEALIKSTGIPPEDDNEPAIVAALAPGTYSIVVRGVNDTTGFANVELYDFE